MTIDMNVNIFCKLNNFLKRKNSPIVVTVIIPRVTITPLLPWFKKIGGLTIRQVVKPTGPFLHKEGRLEITHRIYDFIYVWLGNKLITTLLPINN